MRARNGKHKSASSTTKTTSGMPLTSSNPTKLASKEELRRVELYIEQTRQELLAAMKDQQQQTAGVDSSTTAMSTVHSVPSKDLPKETSCSSMTSSPCLHCSKMITDVSNHVQVSCDSCHGMICKDCHWCHEFQANHEIRVCDRCDAFFCKDCDEMDQCDDCGEVVCSGCCSLLSCKFCGGGLCEDCAVACGRCGIVLCARDAKFAVECDTCKLSYCLVCLASGQKESCIRCGQRPSKRMEQLVHLRLKSIYKAFQQSARNGGGAGSSVGDSSSHSNNNGGGSGNSSSVKQLQSSLQLKRAALAAQKKASASNATSHASTSKHSVSKTTATPTLVDPLVMQAQADAAAASLLKELEEEEAEAAKKQESKKAKKKKKKKRAAAAAAAAAAATTGERTEEHSNQIVDDSKATSSDFSPVAECPELDDESKLTKQPQQEAHPPSVEERKAESETTPAETEADKNSNGKVEHKALEEELLQHVTSRNIGGIETLLEDWKGIPGRAHLRKNAKKALKRLLSEAEEKKAVEKEPEQPAVTSDRLKIVSSQCKGLSSYEVVLHMSPTVMVGWVIGKGGQKIRDLMEESGAKVWIDQETPLEPRVIYVGGPKASVDMAVSKISTLVQEAPITNGEDTAVVNVPDSDATPLAPVPPDAGGSSAGTDWAEHKMTCEARFVPLLIGKRGWTIKHIQDSSGAKVDIDQDKTPRVISITGQSENVQTAIRMVQDVLSYPQNQLGSGGAGQGQHIVGKDDDMLLRRAPEREHSPPPSSLIMTGDIKSIVSASSSLSSTPEPSMASSKGRSAYQEYYQNQAAYSAPPAQLYPPGIFGANRFDESQQYLTPQLRQQQEQQSNFARQQQHFASFPHGPPNIMSTVPPGLPTNDFGQQPMHPPHHQQHHPLPPRHTNLTATQSAQPQPMGFLNQQHAQSAPEQGLLGSLNSFQQSSMQQSQRQHRPVLWDPQQQQPPQRPSTLGNLFPSSSLPVTSATGTTAKASDDADLVDSLFGPSGEASILGGLQGLSLGGSQWGGETGAAVWSGGLGTRLVPEATPAEKSRFSWGA